jgi:hypothetical protein
MHSRQILSRVIHGLGLILLTFIALNITASAQQGGSSGGRVMATVDAGGTGGGGGAAPSKVTFSLYPIDPLCCEPCKSVQRPCSDCCPKTGAFVQSKFVTGDRRMKLEFKDVPAGTYLVVNEVDGQRAGYERIIEVKEGAKTDLGDLAIDNGTPRDAKSNGQKQRDSNTPRNVPGAIKPEQ